MERMKELLAGIGEDVFDEKLSGKWTLYNV
jgi:hypothetical protein